VVYLSVISENISLGRYNCKQYESSSIGVNDNEMTLRALFSALINAGIIPYYLHLLDRVDGSAHFEVSAARGRQLIQDLRNHLPGYAVPRLVQEIAGQPSKTLM